MSEKQYILQPKLQAELKNLAAEQYEQVDKSILLLVREVKSGKEKETLAVGNFGVIVVTKNDKGEYVAGFEDEMLDFTN